MNLLLPAGMILISNDISGLLLSYTIGHFASKGKIRWIGFGVVLSVMACAMESGTQLFVEVQVVIDRKGNYRKKQELNPRFQFIPEGFPLPKVANVMIHVATLHMNLINLS